MIAIPDADSLMDGELGIWLAQQADARAQTRVKIVKRIAGALIIGLPLIAYGWFSFAFFGQGIAMLGLLISGGGLLFAMIARQKMINSLKEQMNGALARALDISYKIKAEPGEEYDLVCSFGLVGGHNRRTFEDFWEGSLNGTSFRLYEADLVMKSGSGKDETTTTVFHGAILKFHFAREFHGVTLVERQRKRMTWFGDSQKKAGVKLDRVKMVDPRFEDVFDIYGSDAVEARYLVHPAYCERLIELEQQFSGKKLKALFYKGDMIVTVESGSMFESASLDPSKDREMLARTIDQFRAMAALITSLNERARSAASG